MLREEVAPTFGHRDLGTVVPSRHHNGKQNVEHLVIDVPTDVERIMIALIEEHPADAR